MIQATVWSKFFFVFSPLSEGPTPPSVPVAPWHCAQLAAKIVLPWAASPAVVVVVVLLDDVPVAGVDTAVVVDVELVDDWSLPLAHPATTRLMITPAARNANGFCMLLSLCEGRRNSFARRPPA